jgi:hypothetical protein
MRRSKRHHRRMAKRGYGTGQLYSKHGAYYGRWRTLDGRKLNRRIGAVRDESSTGGLTRTEAERQFRKLQEAEERRPVRAGAERHTLDEVIDSLRRRLAVEGARKSYLQNCESMQRVHISPRLGDKPLDRVTIADVETVAAAMLDAGLAPKTVRNVITFMHSVFEHAIDRGWATQNPVRRTSRPRPRRAGDANPDSSSSPCRSSRPCCARSPTRWWCASRRRRAAAARAARRRSRRMCSVR